MSVQNPAKPDSFRPPRDNLFRAVFRAPVVGVELRQDGEGDDDGEGGGDEQPRMVGHFAVFNQWTEIRSYFEGNFLERFAPGAFKKTIREQRDSMRVLFQHGRDFSIGDKPLGPIDDLREDQQGAYYEVPLLDAGYVRNEILPGLQAELYGASFRFRVMREEYVEEPGVSEHNPQGLPERTVKEAEVREFGPVTFPAYAGASAGVRSMSDEFIFSRLVSDPERLRELVDYMPADALLRIDPASRMGQTANSSSDPGAAAKPHPGQQKQSRATQDGAGTESHPDHGNRGDTNPPLYGQKPGKEQRPPWQL